MGLFEQKYNNTIRAISGLVNIPYQDDVVLLCNTSGGAVAIQLQSIPANKWNTLWKLYVVDASGNALVNNITVTAPVGYLINGAGSFTINSNNASLLIRVASNTNYVGQYSVISGGGGGGVTNGANVGTGLGQVFKNLVGTILNFKTIKAGTNITITNNADDITIDSIAGGSSAYLFARKNLFIPSVIYVPVAGAITRSVVNGTPMLDFNFKNEIGVTGFDLPTGAWIVDITGWYSVSAKLITRIDPLNVDNNNNLGAFWMALPPPDALGSISLALISQNTNVLCSNKQLVTQSTSDINIDCSVEAVFLTAGDRVITRILNKTDYDIVGVGLNPLLPDCTIQVAVKRL